jgi:phosphoenolpyruvate carboxykinase (ATP)
MNLKEMCYRITGAHPRLYRNLTRSDLIKKTVEEKEAVVASPGCLVTWSAVESTGRAPKDTLIVTRPEIENNIDWESPNNIPLDPQTFDMLWQDALNVVKDSDHLFITERTVGASVSYSMPVKTITPSPLMALFTMNMFRPMLADINLSCFYNRGFTLIVLPKAKVDTRAYQGRLRTMSTGKTSDIAIVMDFVNRLGLVYGSAYMGSTKKLLFTVMNYYLPLEKILPLHCAANENKNTAETSLFLGLSGTGKTTLSADASRLILGDDEHGWSAEGIANFEFGCYAKLLHMDPQKEPDIYQAVFHKATYTEHGAIVENAMMYPDGTFDLDDERLTQNSRASFPLSFLPNAKPSGMGKHPKTIIFLTADANGVLPPVARLNLQQTLLWFLMGYTSKLAGTETGVVIPVSTFSHFFGQPFMPCLPQLYLDMLSANIQKHGSRVYLINTGWSGGPHGSGKRIDLSATRTIVQSALDGLLETVEYRHDGLYHLNVPLTCPGIPPHFLDPSQTWHDTGEYQKRAEKLAREFSDHFEKMYRDKGIDAKIAAECPGKQ